MNSLTKITFSIFIVFFLFACASKPPAFTEDVCLIFTEKKSWYKAAKKSEENWNIPISVSMAFIKQESSFVANARPERTQLLGFIPWKRKSSARGYAQAIDGTWEMYLEETGGWFKQRNDFNDAVDFIGWYNNKSVKELGISRDDARALYLAYHEGIAGFKKGNHRSKPWLLGVADEVNNQSIIYNQQLQSCKKKLGRKFFLFF